MEVQPVKSIKPVELLERGDITRISGRSFVAGVLPIKVNFIIKLKKLIQIILCITYCMVI